MKEQEEALPPARAELRLACALGYFEAHDAERCPPARRWGCPPAEAWVDAQAGVRARYDTLADAPLTIRLEPTLDAAEAAAEAGGLLRLHPGGRWLELASGRIALRDGAVTEVVPWSSGVMRLVWFARADVHPVLRGEVDFDLDAPHHILQIEPVKDERRDVEDMPEECEAYAEWYAINSATDAGALTDALDGPDPDGWRQLALLYRLRRLDAHDALSRLADDAARGLVSLVARSLLSQTDPVMGPSTLDGLPAPA